MSKQFALEDALFIDTGSKGIYIQENILAKYSSYHNGQIKLAMMEILFICNYVLPYMSERGMERATIIYAGAAPGDHIPALLDMFPMISFDLYDPAPFTIMSAVAKYGDRLRINNRPMKEGAIQMINERYSNQDVFFISDVRLPFDAVGAGTEIVNNLSTMNDMRMQLDWHDSINAVYSSLKFHLPYMRFKGREVMNRYVQYADGDLYWQPFARQNGGETRLIVKRGYDTKFYDCQDNEDLHAYQNYVRRQMATYLNPLDASATGLTSLILSMIARSEKYGARGDLIDRTELKPAHLAGRDFDSMYSVWILQQYLRVTGNLSNNPLDVHNRVNNLMLKILKTIDSYKNKFAVDRRYISTGIKTAPRPTESTMVSDAFTNWFTLLQLRRQFIQLCYKSFGFVPSNNSFTRYVLLAMKKNSTLMMPFISISVQDSPTLMKLGENMLTTNRAVVGRYDNLEERDTGIADMIIYVNDLILGAGITADVMKPLTRQSSDYEVLITYARIMLNQLKSLGATEASALEKILNSDIDDQTLWATIGELSTLNLQIDATLLNKFYDTIAQSTNNIKSGNAIFIQVRKNATKSSVFYAVPAPSYAYIDIDALTRQLATYFKIGGYREKYDEDQMRRIVKHFDLTDETEKKFIKGMEKNIKVGTNTLIYLLYISRAPRTEVKNEFARVLMNNKDIGLSTIFNYAAIYADLYTVNSTRYGPTSSGFKRSIPYEAFNAMREYYDINIELYASYFDHVLSTYGSVVYTDTMHKDYPALGDAVTTIDTALNTFNSLSVQANPPYTSDHVRELISIMKRALPSSKSVTFIVILPAFDADLNNSVENELIDYMKVRAVAQRGTSAYIVGTRELDLGTTDEYETDVDIMIFSNRDVNVDNINYIIRAMII